MKDLYEAVVNDVDFVRVFPETVEPADDPAQYRLDGVGLVRTVIAYPKLWSPVDGWKTAPHHLRAPEGFYLDRIAHPWDLLAISAVLRDRHFLPSIRLMRPA
jgi:hypothetical protein